MRFINKKTRICGLYVEREHVVLELSDDLQLKCNLYIIKVLQYTEIYYKISMYARIVGSTNENKNLEQTKI